MWVKIENVKHLNLKEIMLEEITKKNQEKKNRDELVRCVPSKYLEDDAQIAKILQVQFDKDPAQEEFNYSLNNEKIDNELQCDYEQKISIQEQNDLEGYNLVKDVCTPIPYCGHKKPSDGKVVTKHDIIMSGKRNTNNKDELDLFLLKLSNRIIDNEKINSNKRKQMRKQKLHVENKNAAVLKIDKYAYILLREMVNDKFIRSINRIVSIGKEAVILHANYMNPSSNSNIERRQECVIKVYKESVLKYKHLSTNLTCDQRFKSRIDKGDKKKWVDLWAEKEMENLIRIKDAGILCPQFIALKHHVLVMSFIGEDCRPAPKLKDATLRREELLDAYDQIVEMMKTMYKKANLIHSDLSESNILWYKKQCYFIDVSEALEPTTVGAFRCLYKDCEKVIKFFEKRDLYHDILLVDTLFTYITGCHINDHFAIMALAESFKRELYPEITKSGNY